MADEYYEDERSAPKEKRHKDLIIRSSAELEKHIQVLRRRWSEDPAVRSPPTIRFADGKTLTASLTKDLYFSIGTGIRVDLEDGAYFIKYGGKEYAMLVALFRGVMHAKPAKDEAILMAEINNDWKRNEGKNFQWMKHRGLIGTTDGTVVLEDKTDERVQQRAKQNAAERAVTGRMYFLTPLGLQVAAMLENAEKPLALLWEGHNDVKRVSPNQRSDIFHQYKGWINQSKPRNVDGKQRAPRSSTGAGAGAGGQAPKPATKDKRKAAAAPRADARGQAAAAVIAVDDDDTDDEDFIDVPDDDDEYWARAQAYAAASLKASGMGSGGSGGAGVGGSAGRPGYPSSSAAASPRVGPSQSSASGPSALSASRHGAYGASSSGAVSSSQASAGSSGTGHAQPGTGSSSKKDGHWTVPQSMIKAVGLEGWVPTFDLDGSQSDSEIDQSHQSSREIDLTVSSNSGANASRGPAHSPGDDDPILQQALLDSVLDQSMSMAVATGLATAVGMGSGRAGARAQTSGSALAQSAAKGPDVQSTSRKRARNDDGAAVPLMAGRSIHIDDDDEDEVDGDGDGPYGGHGTAAGARLPGSAAMKRSRLDTGSSAGDSAGDTSSSGTGAGAVPASSIALNTAGKRPHSPVKQRTTLLRTGGSAGAVASSQGSYSSAALGSGPGSGAATSSAAPSASAVAVDLQPAAVTGASSSSSADAIVIMDSQEAVEQGQEVGCGQDEHIGGGSGGSGGAGREPSTAAVHGQHQQPQYQGYEDYVGQYGQGDYGFSQSSGGYDGQYDASDEHGDNGHDDHGSAAIVGAALTHHGNGSGASTDGNAAPTGRRGDGTDDAPVMVDSLEMDS